MIMLIQLCKKYSKRKKLTKKILLKFPDSNIKVKSCIGMCKYCKSQAVAKVDGKKIKKKNIKKLLEEIE